MGRKSTSSIARLPKPLLDEINRRLRDGQTYDDVLAAVQGMGGSISRSALGRYGKRFQEAAEAIMRTREMALAIGTDLGESDTTAVRMIAEHLHSLLFKVQMSLEQEGAPDPKTLQQLSEALKNIVMAVKHSTDTELKIRARAVAEAAETAEQVAKSEGLSQSTIEAIKASILGLRGGA